MRLFRWLPVAGLGAILVGMILPACEPGGYIRFENQRNEPVTIVFTYMRANGTGGTPTVQDTIAARSTRELGITFLRTDDIQRIEANDPSGIVVLQRDYKMADLEKIGWKIVIPP